MRKAIEKNSLFFELGAKQKKDGNNMFFLKSIDTHKKAELEGVLFFAGLLLALPIMTALLLLFFKLV
ncbi:MAG: hypothetical protein AAF969_09440 [Bacteroidota bacterium]